MEKLMYMVMLEKSKTYNKMTKKVVTEHVENIRRLDDEGKLEICGVFKGYPGMAGMYILKADSREEAEALCDREPLDMQPVNWLPCRLRIGKITICCKLGIKQRRNLICHLPNYVFTRSNRKRRRNLKR